MYRSPKKDLIRSIRALSLAALAAAPIVLLSNAPAWAFYGPGAGHGAHMWDGGSGWGGGFFGPLPMILLVVAVVATVLYLFRRPENPSSATVRPSSAIDILEERYARGEIDLEEFETRRRALKS